MPADAPAVRLVCPMLPTYDPHAPARLTAMGYTAGLYRIPYPWAAFKPWSEAPPHPVFLYGGVSPKSPPNNRMRALCSRFPYSIKAVLFGNYTPRLREYAGVPLWKIAATPHDLGHWPYVATTPGLDRHDVFGRLRAWQIHAASWAAQRAQWQETLVASSLVTVPPHVFLTGETPTDITRLFGEVEPFLGSKR